MNSANPIKARFRISTQLNTAIGFTVVLTIIAVLFSWVSFERIRESQNRVNEISLPEMVVAFGIARSSASLVAAAPRLTSALSIEEVADVYNEIGMVGGDFSNLLKELHELGNIDDLGAGNELDDLLAGVADDLVANINEIEQSMSAYFDLKEKVDRFHIELNEYEETLRVTLLPVIDDHFFYLMTGYRDLNEDPVNRSVHLSEAEVNHYRYVAGLEQQANAAVQLLASGAVVTDAARIEVLREQFQSVTDGINRNLASLPETLTARLIPLFDRLQEFGFGEHNGFTLRRQELQIQARQAELLESNNVLAIALVDVVEDSVANANVRALEAISAADSVAKRTRQVLLFLGMVSVLAAFLIAWLYVGRKLLRRLEELSVRMRSMARGELEQPVIIRGNDEIADMASALEVFRSHALEVQRLNLVEKLAAEVQDKNTELESVLEELRTAQNQIVMREKLAALGELTAGVAHEIKNPLNFVKNFAEACEELLEELDEAVEMTEESREEQMEEIRSVAEILVDNLARIKHHAGRADRIVHDMLSMGRGEGHAQKVDLNRIVEENTKLAFHGARATTQDLQLKITKDLDQNIGTVYLVPQDVGRVILNMVGNACYETHKKFQELRENLGEDAIPEFMPELQVTTKRTESGVRILIRDNGNGIPEENITKIFNPFFTTKPTDKGTGLGLSLSNDIIREHGGQISVESGVGEYTQMIIDLPMDARQMLSLAEEEDSDED